MIMPTSAEGPPQSILLVDDLPANLELLAGMLKSKGYKTRAAVSGEAALQAVEAELPDLVLLDINMPGMSGYEVCERLKAVEKFRDVPVIFLSALSETLDKVRAFGAGGVDYVSKPFQFEEVEARVRAHLELRRQKRELKDSYERLKELEKMRDGLVHMIVHDLRSPLAVILSYMDFLKKDSSGVLPPAALEDMEETRKAADVMMRMVSDLLDASKMESGKMKLSLADCDLPALLEEAAASMKPLAGARRLSVVPGQGKVKADRELICRVVQNLVGNALKFAPKEGGYVRLAVSPSAAGVRVTVENNGPDIPAEYQEEIFEKFGQVTSGGVRKPFSTGLGLHFCKLAVEAHGGSIGVESAPGQPTVFWFELKA
ncbi:MAG: hypothetical protein A2X35_02975 [Elusimicrobia bacterium GWA2_61_42]|nr:MAG: hypothetical protein A2X35_02975 [Elusimicrobia bacterium GWA2_61_42]OGR74796.1 MAG: hypothetical protein A2X38_08520 [Elusimicrobia bacterium GWC2_61_25]